MANKLALETEGFEELLAQLHRAGVDSKQAAEKALIEGNKAVTPGIRDAMARHHRTGATEASLDTKEEVRFVGTVAETDIGFHVRQGGLPSIFLMYGTPRMQPDKRLYNAVYGSEARKKFNDAAEKALDDLMKKVGG